MVSPFNQTVQNTAKCPHGNPVGACPICAGMGGGGIKKDRDKPRRAGEMTYNECLAEWHKMQAQKEAKNQAKLQMQDAKMQNLKEISFQRRLLNGLEKIQKNFSNIFQNIEKLPNIIKAPIKFILNNLVKPVFNFVLNTISAAGKNIHMFFSNIGNFINSVGEKLAMIFGEIKNFSDNAFFKKDKKKLKTILSMMAEEEKEETSEEAQKIKAREMKKILKSFLNGKKAKNKLK